MRYPEYRKNLFSKKDVQNFGKTSKPLRGGDRGRRTVGMTRDVTL
jgi:hypothetical protein